MWQTGQGYLSERCRQEETQSPTHCGSGVSWTENGRQSQSTPEATSARVSPAWQDCHQKRQAHHHQTHSAVRSGRHQAGKKSNKQHTHTCSDCTVGGADGGGRRMKDNSGTIWSRWPKPAESSKADRWRSQETSGQSRCYRSLQNLVKFEEETVEEMNT